MKLAAIMSDLVRLARSSPGQTQRRQLGGGLQVLVRVEAGRLIVGCTRLAGKGPSDAEMKILLRDCQAPEQALRTSTWERKTKGSAVYLYTQWDMQPELLSEH